MLCDLRVKRLKVTEIWSNYFSTYQTPSNLGTVQASVSNADYRLPGYPGIGSFFQYSNTQVIGPSTRALKLKPNFKDILQFKYKVLIIIIFNLKL
jgi:hypothetical protein